MREAVAVRRAATSHSGHRLAVLLVAGAVLAGGCTSGGAPTDPDSAAVASDVRQRAATFDDLDRSLQARTSRDGIGAVALVVRDGTTVFAHTYGDMDGATRIPIASASKWLTAATVMTFVDDGSLTLDDPVSRWLPALSGDAATITLRQLLSHTSGIGSNGCIWERDTTMATCVDEIAGDDLVEPPGRRFHYGNTSFQVAARLAEVVGGEPFEQIFRHRLAEPLGMTATRFDEGSPTANPTPAASGESTADDYARFLEMLLAGGTRAGVRVLSEESVAAILHTQVAGMENIDDGAVTITGDPDYGLGCWLDELDPTGASIVASGSGSLGAYPFVDRRHRAYGMIWLHDPAHSDGRAVQRSQAQARQAIKALDALDPPSATTPVTVG